MAALCEGEMKPVRREKLGRWVSLMKKGNFINIRQVKKVVNEVGQYG
jgi:hypothetical protein